MGEKKKSAKQRGEGKKVIGKKKLRLSRFMRKARKDVPRAIGDEGKSEKGKEVVENEEYGHGWVGCITKIYQVEKCV